MAALVGVMFYAACGGGSDRPLTAPPEPRPFYGTPCSEYDTNIDGTVDTVWTYTYDADKFETGYSSSDGLVTQIAYDSDHFVLHTITTGDDFTQQETYTRDPDGRVLTYVMSDGTDSESDEYTYDDMGRLIASSSTDDSGTTTAEYTYTGEHLNPATGRITSEGATTSLVYTTSDDDRTLHTDRDDGDDGTIDGTIDTTYDARHRLLTQRTLSMGQFSQSITATYASNGFTATYIQDATEGDPVDYDYTATFDGSGRMATNQMTSPSGELEDYEYVETAKQTCATPTARSTSHKLQVAAARRHGPRGGRVGDQL